MSKMTDKDIIKALECCVKAPYCNEKTDCPYKGIDDCVKKHTLDALDLINRQQSVIDVYMQENDRLKTAYIQVSEDRNEIRKETEAEIERLNNNLSAMATTLSNSARQTRADAIKEFEERLKEKAYRPNPYPYIEILTKEDIDNLVKEMVGDGK